MAIYLGCNVVFLSNKSKYNALANKICIQSPQLIGDFYDKNKKYLCDSEKILFNMTEIYLKNNMTSEALMSLNQLNKLMNRNDIEMLRAKCHIKQGEYKLAEKHLKLSVAMCPNRFINRYELFKFYKDNNMEYCAMRVAQSIYYLDEKIVSPHTIAIKQEIEEYLLKNNVLLH